MAQIAAEIHTEIGQILHHHNIIFCSQLTNNSQFRFLQTYPRRIVRIRINNRRHIARQEHLFQLLTQSLATIVINIKLLPRSTNHSQLRLLNRKSRVDKQHLISTLLALHTGYKRAKRACNTSNSRYTSAGRYIDIQECLYKA